MCLKILRTFARLGEASWRLSWSFINYPAFVVNMAKGLWLDQRNFGIHVEDCLDAFGQLREHIFDRFQAIEEGNRVGDFDFYFEGIDAILSAKNELVTGADTFDIAQNLLDLRGEKFHAAEANQVIGPAQDPGHTEEGPSAGARLRV